jgi:hypothetical protein
MNEREFQAQAMEEAWNVFEEIQEICRRAGLDYTGGCAILLGALAMQAECKGIGDDNMARWINDAWPEMKEWAMLLHKQRHCNADAHVGNLTRH